MKRILVIVGCLVAFGFLAGWLAFSRFNLAAIPNPGEYEIYFATKAKHALIARAVREGIPARPNDKTASAKEGDKLFAMRCSLCHGEDGRGASPLGQWMYPRAADLASDETRSYSDQELFWVIRNGIRLSGMPAFARTETDEHIWNMVDYLRTLQESRR